jgi:hypothetical protein
MKEITITVKGFKTKKQAIAWLEQYEGGIEQNFDTEEPIEFPAMTTMKSYIPEMKEFKNNEEKLNFNLEVI